MSLHLFTPCKTFAYPFSFSNFTGKSYLPRTKSVKGQIITFCAFSFLPLRQVHTITEDVSVCLGSWRLEEIYQRCLAGRTGMMGSGRSCWACGLRDGSRVSVQDFGSMPSAADTSTRILQARRLPDRRTDSKGKRKVTFCSPQRSHARGRKGRKGVVELEMFVMDILGFLRDTLSCIR